ESVRKLTDRVLVLDSGSNDRTLEIAQQHGARIEYREFDGYATQRNAAIALANTEWILFLDADESLPDALVNGIRSVMSDPPPGVHGYRIARDNKFGTRVLRGGGWWPDAQLRLFRREHGSYDPTIQV